MTFDNRHPMLRAKRPIIFTRPAERLASYSRGSLEIGSSAVWIEGFARFGKTCGARQLATSETWRPYCMYIVEYSYTKPSKPSEAYFATGLLERHGQKAFKTDFSNQTILRFTRMLREQVQRTGAEVVSFIINEANRFTTEEYDTLLSIDNELENFVRTFHFLVNQCDTERFGPEGMDKTPPAQIAGRYFTSTHHYTGLLWDIPEGDLTIQLLSDVALGFKEYDELMMWPPDSGITYTQYFAPKAYALGWRLGSQIDLIKEVINEMRAEQSIGPVTQWPMQSFEHFVYVVLVRIAGDNPDFIELTKPDIRNALKHACYLPLEPEFRGRH